jgi:hypothetical protein
MGQFLSKKNVPTIEMEEKTKKTRFFFIFEPSISFKMEQGALQEVLSFSGKRNCVFTFVVGGDISLAELKKHLGQ